MRVTMDASQQDNQMNTSDSINIRQQSRSDLIDKHAHLTTTSIICGIFVVVLSGFLYSVVAVLVKWANTIGHSSAMMLFYQSIFQILFAVLTSLLSSQCDQIYKCKSKCHPKQMCTRNCIQNMPKTHTDRSDTTHDTNDTNLEDKDVTNISETFSLQQIESTNSLPVDEISPIISPTPWIAILSHGMFSAMATYLYFTAAQLIPIGSAVTLTSLSCVCGSLFGWILFKDIITRYHFVAFVLGLNGALLISQPSVVFRNTVHGQIDYDGDIYCVGSIVAIICALMLGFVHLSLRFAKETSCILLMISHGIFSLILAVILLLPFDVKWIQSTQDIICVTSVGFIGFVAQWTMIKGTRMLIEGVSSLLKSSVNVLCSFMFQIILFKMYPDTISIFGAMMTLAANVIITVERSRAANKADIKREQGANVSLQSISCDADNI